MLTTMIKFHPLILVMCFGGLSASLVAADVIKHAEQATFVDYDASFFAADPINPTLRYDAEAQLDIYRNKPALVIHRPLLELGRSIYTTGPLATPSTWFGTKNPTLQQFSIYGDWRTTAAVHDIDDEQANTLATRLNLDIDWKLTATERLHAQLRPFEDNGNITRIENRQPKNQEADTNTESELVFDLDTLYLEGDLASLVSGWSQDYASWDLPFALGLMPLVLQNGVWLDDAFTGIAVSIPARHSTLLDISNMDVTLFAGFDEVSSAITVESDEAALLGITTFIEANQGYWELGYGYTLDNSELGDQSYHNITGAFTRRYGGWLSNSMRIIGNVGQNRKNNALTTADGWLLLIENSWITTKPSTWIPYFNLFVGIDRPQSLARAGGAGGVLRNTGITFESEVLNGLPTLETSANDTLGGALGMEYLFALNQQLVVELAVLSAQGDEAQRIVVGDQFGLGIRYQRPVTNAWIVRGDASIVQTQADNTLTTWGVALEVRRKF